MKKTALSARQPVRREMVRFKFVRETISELRKVVWPTWVEARKLTAIVIAVSVAVGALLGTTDYVFYWVINELILRPR